MQVCSPNLVAATWSEFNDWLVTGILHLPYEEILQCRRIGADRIFKESEDVFHPSSRHGLKGHPSKML